MLPMEIPFPEIDPALFTLPIGAWFGIGDFSFSLRWYALAYIVGLILGWRIAVWLVKRPTLWPANRVPMTPEQPEELLTWMVIGVILGGRLGFVLFYDFPRFAANPVEILQIWNGGMSFHGGFIGVILGTIGYCRAKGIPVLSAGDAVALGAPTGLLLGRLANFINAELWGRPTDVSWAMVFPSVPPERWIDGVNVPRHPSQLYEAALEGAVLFAVMWWLGVGRGWLKHPGAVIGVFFIGYGAARTFVENFRQGDLQFVTATNPNGQFLRFGDSADALGLTMGQILSLPMIAIGIGFLLVAFRRARA